MEKAEYVDRVAIREKVCTGCTMLVDGVCCDADPCENLIAGFLEEPPADVVPAHRKENAHSIPLTLDELREMDGEPVWVVYDEDAGMWALVEVCEESIFLTNNLGGRSEYAADVELEDDGITVYRQKPEEGTV